MFTPSLSPIGSLLWAGFGICFIRPHRSISSELNLVEPIAASLAPPPSTFTGRCL